VVIYPIHSHPVANLHTVFGDRTKVKIKPVTLDSNPNDHNLIMTSPQPQDWQTRIRNLKLELERVTAAKSAHLNEVDFDTPGFGIETLQRSYQQFLAWFNNIPASGKLLAIAGGGLLSLTLIKTVFQLISSLITLSIFGIILYLVYRFWILPKGSES
jgi:hypothetical protein